MGSYITACEALGDVPGPWPSHRATGSSCSELAVNYAVALGGVGCLHSAFDPGAQQSDNIA
jgi:hypothetical protein